jgi:hypothetical protein
MDRDAAVSDANTLRLAAKAFTHTAQYDAMVASYLDRAHADAPRRPRIPRLLPLQYRKRLDLRYGEKPHQQAAFYVASDAQGASVGSASQVAGQGTSFNNVADADTALECVRQFDAPACVIVKHANPCGVAVAASIREAYDRLSHGSDLGVRRHHRVQPRARCATASCHRRAPVRRSDHRAGDRRRKRARSARRRKTCGCSSRAASAEQQSHRSAQRERRLAHPDA